MLKDEFVEKLNSLSKESLIKYLSSTNFANERDLIFKECAGYELFKLTRKKLEILSRKSELISNKNNSIDKVENLIDLILNLISFARNLMILKRNMKV